jgi:hypothetical protein
MHRAIYVSRELELYSSASQVCLPIKPDNADGAKILEWSECINRKGSHELKELGSEMEGHIHLNHAHVILCSPGGSTPSTAVCDTHSA